MVYCDWLPTAEVNNCRDAFLKLVATALSGSAGLDSDGTLVHPLGEFLGILKD